MGFLKPKTRERPKVEDKTPAQLAAQARRQRRLNAGHASTIVAGNKPQQSPSGNKPTLGGTG